VVLASWIHKILIYQAWFRFNLSHC
jgi:hypothetical protein